MARPVLQVLGDSLDQPVDVVGRGAKTEAGA
jgi:hypothetical protein